MLLWNRALVVAGPADVVEIFETAAAAGRLKTILPPTHLTRGRQQQWRERPTFSLRPLLRLVPPPSRRLRHQLPREKSPLVASRLETIDGKLRLEYRFAATGSTAAIEHLARAIVARHPSLSFVVASVDRAATDARACLITPEGIDRYRLSPNRRSAHIRREARKWGRDDVGREFALKEASEAMLTETCSRWDVMLAGSVKIVRDGQVYQYDPPVFAPNPTNRRLVVAGPAAEVEWLVARARGRLRAPSRRGSPWRSRPEISFRALADLLPADVRPVELPPDTEPSWLDDIWAHENLLRARWILTDYEWEDDAALERLLIALSGRYRQLCFVACWEEPDTFEAEGSFVWRGRLAKHSVSRADHDRIMKSVYARHGLTLDDGGDEDTEAVADSEVDEELLECAEYYWDARVLRTLKA